MQRQQETDGFGVIVKAVAGAGEVFVVGHHQLCAERLVPLAVGFEVLVGGCMVGIAGGRIEPGGWESKRLQQQAVNTTQAQFGNSPHRATELINTIMNRLDDHATMSTQALNHSAVQVYLKISSSTWQTCGKCSGRALACLMNLVR
ncbi:hypothetical protein KBY97_14255 [Synechococcus sp. ATX 2A4]|uniref:hypothetical protein n=1 Tax=Synechococcus sp. ATX 2A4 TaxID=2823727 RepID=UPI0020CFCCCD|nr:hypothetical protein [Synechococcus sp. ATX 2A4]MCP9886274.1 hypothetical protein [Synechococcus sp. ATX 2A4]